jgi:hypothetical protein
MNNQEILKVKPEGATHVNHKNKFFWFDGDEQFIYKPKTDDWLMTFYHENKLDRVRSIADIEEIESLRAQLKTAKADGMTEVATQRCPVSGFVVSNEKSRLEILDYADSLSKGKDCE